MINFILFIASLFVVIKAADFAILYSSKFAKGLRVSKYIIGFLLVAVISVMPETFISISSAVQGESSFGLGTLFGSNVADLSLIFAIIILLSAHPIRIESKVIKNSPLYILILAVPILLGLNGYYSRIEGVVIIMVGLIFYFFMLHKKKKTNRVIKKKFSWNYFSLLACSMAILLFASIMTVKFGVRFANDLHVNEVLVAMLFVGLGTTLPELFFSIKAIKANHDGLAIGDLMGTVITDATILVGILAVIRPFAFNGRIVYVTGIFMLVAAIVLLYFMRSGRSLTKKEGLLLLAYYLVFVLAELAVNYQS